MIKLMWYLNPKGWWLADLETLEASASTFPNGWEHTYKMAFPKKVIETEIKEKCLILLEIH